MFLKAKPVWLNGLQGKMNVQGIFSAKFQVEKRNDVNLIITGATLYRIKINGDFVGYGPARAPHGYAIVDTIDISDYLLQGNNLVELEVAGYNCGSYYGTKQLSFICAEIIQKGSPLAYT